MEFKIYIFILGIIFGSFLNVLILRLPKRESLFYPPSACPKCKNKLKYYHNIPILSWILLGGKCGFCKEKISIQYPLIELLIGFLFLYCIEIDDFTTFASTLSLALCFSLLFALCVIDFRYLEVPSFTLILSLVFALIYMHSLEGIKNALMFAGGAYLLKSFLESIINARAKSDLDCVQVMGEADIEIIALIGCLLGVKLALVAIFLAALISLPVFMFLRLKGKQNIQVPFIPFLSAGLALVWFLPSVGQFCLDFVQ